MQQYKYTYNYEIEGKIINIKDLLNEIIKESNFNNKFKVKIENDIDLLKIKKSYIKNMLKSLIYDNFRSSVKNAIVINIFKSVDNKINIKIIIILNSKNKSAYINDYEIQFIMELHNSSYIISNCELEHSILLTFPEYRLQKAYKPDSVHV